MLVIFRKTNMVESDRPSYCVFHGSIKKTEVHQIWKPRDFFQVRTRLVTKHNYNKYN